MTRLCTTRSRCGEQ